LKVPTQTIEDIRKIFYGIHYLESIKILILKGLSIPDRLTLIATTIPVESLGYRKIKKENLYDV
jgi:hypothetical protein